MRLETWTMPHAMPGYSSPKAGVRVITAQTAGGVVVHTSAGHVGDEPWELLFDGLNAAPKDTQIRTYAPTAVVSDSIGPNGALAYAISVAANGFAAISVATMTLKRSAGATGTLTVEVWDRNGTLPNRKVGLLGVLDAATDLSEAWQEITVWSRTAAWPLLYPGGFLVLNGNGLTAGTVSWAGEVAAPNAHAEWNPGTSTWALAAGELSATVWQGGDWLVLEGFRLAYCYPNGAGPQQWTLEADDLNLYEVVLMDTRGRWQLAPWSADWEGWMDEVGAAFALVSETGQMALGVT